MTTRHPRIIVALDYPHIDPLWAFVNQLTPADCRLKIGLTLFVHYGPPLVTALIEQGFEVFLDLKLHDIPEQVQGACHSAADLGVWMLTVHAAGGLAMLQAARAAIDRLPAGKRPLLVAVTALTSLDQADLNALGWQGSTADMVLRLAKISHQAGLDGVVCSAQEAHFLRQHLPNDFILVTPGIRLNADSTQDQKRIMTPAQAIQAGANYLVIGRPITQADNPHQTLFELNQTLP